MSEVQDARRWEYYRSLAERYLEWLIVKLGTGENDSERYETGLKGLCKLYNHVCDTGSFPMKLPEDTDVEDWIQEIGAPEISLAEKQEIILEFEHLLIERIEDETHQSNWLNP